MLQTPAESEAAIREAVERIATRFQPLKVILYGSRARGEGGPDSDADLLVVMPVNGSKRQQAVQMDLALEGIPIPIDLIVVTPEEVEKYRDAMGTIIREAVREGKVLYERAA
jgi:predicted nucleotidyltransferase